MALRGPKLLREARRFAPDLVHGHWAVPSGDVALQLARRLDVPSVVSVHGFDLAVTARASLESRVHVRRILSDVDLVIANSSSTREEIAELTDGRASVRVLWQGGDSCAASSIVHSPVRIVTIGNLFPHKGIHEAVDVLSQCHSMGLDFQWLIIGSGSAAATSLLMERLAAGGLTRVTRHIPQMMNQQVLDVLGESDILLHLPSREAYGIVVAEAMGAGTAVVGSVAAGAVTDFSANGAPVLGVSPEDPGAAFCALAGLLLDPGRLSAVKLASADWARGHLGWDRYTHALAEAYSLLILGDGEHGIS